MTGARLQRVLATLLAALLCGAAGNAAAAQPGRQERPTAGAEVRFISLAPSPYTRRHDAMRAGLGVHLLLQQVIAEHGLPLRSTFHDGAARLQTPSYLKDLTRGARVLVIGGSTWAQGSARFLREFLEIVGDQDLTGQSVSAWATAGGSHTGGEQLVADTLRSAMGMGAQAFTLGQKYMVFSTDERTGIADGHFSLLDAWLMDQFARTLAVTALAGHDASRARALAVQLGTSPFYYRSLPKDEALLARYRPLLDRLNAAADESSPAWRDLQSQVR